MSLRNLCGTKRVTGEEAIAHIKSGQRIFISHCSAEPAYLVELLANVGAFGPIVAVKSMQPPIPVMDFIPGVGNLPAGGMAYINKRLNEIKK